MHWSTTQHTVLILPALFAHHFIALTLKVLVMIIGALRHFKQGNHSTVGGDGGCRGGEVRSGTTSPMPDHKGFKLQ